MPAPSAPSSRPSALLGRKNLLMLGLGLLVVVAGYLLLQAGGTTVAAALLVVGYCVLIPLGLAL